jgi:hypothetical protein
VSALLTPAEVAALLCVKDPRTVRRHLAALGVPRIVLGGSWRVRAAALERALAAAEIIERPAGAAAHPAGVNLAPDERLWDGGPELHVGARRANGRPRGTRRCELQMHGEITAVPGDSRPLRVPSTREG